MVEILLSKMYIEGALMSNFRNIALTRRFYIIIAISGRDPPKFITSFEAGQLYETVLENVRKARYDRPTPVQKYGIPVIANGRDLMACAQTGSGKTVR